MVCTTREDNQQEDSGDITRLWIAYKQDPNNRMLRNRLIERYMPLVRYNAEKLLGSIA
ncbi:MAG: hypothetical protein KatS3mg114_0533 [Planctomycetaceae bacterium]|nr:MAG: hypothetical protein KatS3mg114_0533 [Planctomycetaceae bacterium]